MENRIKIDNLGVPLFLETPIYIYALSLVGYTLHTYWYICQNMSS